MTDEDRAELPLFLDRWGEDLAPVLTEYARCIAISQVLNWGQGQADAAKALRQAKQLVDPSGRDFAAKRLVCLALAEAAAGRLEWDMATCRFVGFVAREVSR